MGFNDAVAAALGKYASFQGRARRAEYWWFVLFAIGINLIGSALDMLFGWAEVGVFAVLFSLALLLPSIAVLVRRIHDLDRSGWWALLPLLAAPLLGGALLPLGDAGVALGALVILAAWVVMIVFLARPGTPGPNRFGPDPRATSRPWETAGRSSGS